MLATQVSYWTLQESIRHSKATEAETHRANKEAESINWFNAYENKRHNVAVEEETHRHNVETETYYNNALAETQRHNIVSEQLGYVNAGIGMYNAETNRFAAQQTAAIGWFNAEVNKTLGVRQSEVNYMNALSQAQQAEAASTRANTEAYTSRQNVAINYVNAGSNASQAESRRQSLDIDQQRTDISEQQLDLDIRKQQWKQTTDTINILNNVGMSQSSGSSMPTQPTGFTSLTP